MTLSTPAKPARRRKIVAVCTCPACLVGYYTSPQGVFFCRETRDFAAYAGGSPLSFHKFETAATEALGVYLIDQAKAEAVEVAAAEADLDHDVAQASTDADVVAALAEKPASKWTQLQPAPRLFIPATIYQPTAEMREAELVADLDTHRLNATLPEMPSPLFWSSTLGGVTWAGHADAYPSFLAADEARGPKPDPLEDYNQQLAARIFTPHR